MTKPKAEFDEIGPWSEVKLEIVRKYAKAYSTILTKQAGFTHYYIDGFAGAGVHLSKTSHKWVPGSPLNALNVVPPFKHYFLVDLDGNRISQLKEMVGDRDDVTPLHGDSNKVLIEAVFPRVRYERRQRALCLLDPYGLHLSWRVIAAAGQSGAIDLFLNFPIMDINQNALWTNPAKVKATQAARMTAFWGDESWREIAYRESPQATLFGDSEVEKVSNEVVVEAFAERLKRVAGFRWVPKPMPMRNRRNAVVYYLFFASQKAVARDIVNDIFNRYGG